MSGTAATSHYGWVCIWCHHVHTDAAQPRRCINCAAASSGLVKADPRTLKALRTHPLRVAPSADLERNHHRPRDAPQGSNRTPDTPRRETGAQSAAVDS